MKRILITGAAGFIGSSLAKTLTTEDFQLILVDNLSKGRKESLDHLADKLIVGDLSDSKFVKTLPKVEIIIHLAGQSSGERSMELPIQDLKDNYISTVNLVQYAKDHGIEKFVFASSMSVYGDDINGTTPNTNYGVHKLSSELFLKNNLKGIQTLILRFFNVYGPGQDLIDLKQGMVSIFISQAISSDTIKVKGSLKRERDFIYIQDLVDFIHHELRVCKSQNLYVTHDIASGEALTVEKLIEEIMEQWGTRKVQVLPGTPGDQFKVHSTNSPLAEVLGRPTIKIKEGLSLWKKEIESKF
jgi:UDP-glucose 4-epimerase